MNRFTRFTGDAANHHVIIVIPFRRLLCLEAENCMCFQIETPAVIVFAGSRRRQKVADMAETTFAQLGLRAGPAAGYVYIHQVACFVEPDTHTLCPVMTASNDE